MIKRSRKPVYPHVKRGEPGWLEALAACKGAEHAVAMRFGVVVFRPTDPRAEIIRQHKPEAAQ